MYFLFVCLFASFNGGGARRITRSRVKTLKVFIRSRECSGERKGSLNRLVDFIGKIPSLFKVQGSP